MNGEPGRVVVGVSSFDFRLPMVRWAAAEAAARGARLHLVTAVPLPAAPDRYIPADAADAIRDTARERLDHAEKHAAEHRPGLAISTEIAGGRPVDVLWHVAVDADLLVVGADDQSPFAEAVTGSVPGTLLTIAPCPLAVVPHADTAVRDDAPVLVALDEPGTSQATLAYGFAAADRSSRTLHVLRCAPPGQHERTDDVDRARTLIGFSALYPHVEVTQETAVGDPRDVLAGRSRAAAALVLGSRGHGRFASALFGSVSRDLIRRSGCPVIVARPQSANVSEGAL